MASLLKKGGAGKSLPQGAAEDASRAVSCAIEELAAKHGVELDLPSNSAPVNESKEGEKSESMQRGARRISQETFDMVVRENIDDFEMEAEEAVKDAVEQFESQGVDLSNIVKSVEGTNSGPIPEILERLAATESVEAACSCLGEFSQLCRAAVENRLVAISRDAEGTIFGTLGRVDKESPELVAAALGAFGCLQWKERERTPIYPIAKPVLSMVFSVENLAQSSLWALALRVAKIACLRNEPSKNSLFTEYGFDSHTRRALQLGLAEKNVELIREAAAFIRVLCTDDDRRQGVHPNTFQRARSLADQKLALNVIGDVVSALELASQQAEADFAADMALAVRVLAVNNDICKDFTDRGATRMLVEIMNAFMQEVKVVRCVCLALKMISNNDENKRILVQNGGLDAILLAMSTHTQSSTLQEQCLAALSSLALRHPGNCTTIVEKHGVISTLSAMERFPAAAGVQRSACLVLRNIVARNKEYVPVILDGGAEHLLRLARKSHPICDDVAYAALRDLGCAASYKQ